MNELYTLEEQSEIFAVIPRVIDVLGGSLDEMFWTPLRDIQVFGPKLFRGFTGATHPVIAGLLVSASLVANLGYLGKIFNKNKVESLSEVLENCREEFGDKYCFLDFDGTLSDENHRSLTAYFQQDLINKGFGYLDADIVLVKGDYQLHYRFNQTFKDILKSQKTYAEIIHSLDLSDKKDAAIKAQLDNMVPETDRENKSIAQIRDEYFQKIKSLNKTKASDAGKVAFDFSNDIAFNFWLVYFVSDMVYSNADTNGWSIRAQVVTLALALGISLVKGTAKLWAYIRRKKSGAEKENALKTDADVKVVNASLQHKQQTSFFIRMLQKYNTDRLTPSQKLFTEDDISAVVLPGKSLGKRFRHYFFSIVKSAQEHEDIIRDETIDKKTSYVQKTTALKTAGNMGIIAAFMEWVGGIALSTISGAKKVINFFDGTGGGILGVVAGIVGGLLGFLYYHKSIKPKLEQEKAELKKLFHKEEIKHKFKTLKILETENRTLRKLIKQNNLEKLPVMKGHDDRAFRRLVPSQKTTAFTYGKKIVNRFGVVVGRMGTGVLLFRLIPLTILGIVGISLTATVAAVLWPVTIAALVVGAVWASIFLYQYIQERRIASAKNFIHDIDNRLEAEQSANDTYRSQLNLAKKSERYNASVQEKIYEADAEEEAFSDTESSEESEKQNIKPDKEALPLKQTTKLPTVKAKALSFWQEPPRVQADEMHYGAPSFRIF